MTLPRSRLSLVRIRWPVVRGIARLAGDSYAATFGRQWNRYEVARNDEDETTFQIKTGIAPAALAGKLVLDAGCGGGRYSRQVGLHGAKVLGVDLSAAVEKAALLCADLPDVSIVQADLLDLPVADAAFDMVFSIGVLHHTPQPRRAFAEIAREGQAGRAAGSLAVSKEFVAARMAQHGVKDGLDQAAGTRSSSRSVPGWACWAACRF